MRKTFTILFFALCASPVFAQKESGEYPWAKAAKIIDANDAKSRKAEQKRETGTEKSGKKSEKKPDAENRKAQQQ
jgi:hypothetical protein